MKIFEDKDFYRKLFSLAIPIALQNLIYSSLNMIDTVMIGKLGDTSIAAVGAANKVFFLLNLFLFGVNSGSAIFTAQYWGKKDIKNIKRVLGLCIILGVLGSVPFTIIALFCPQVFMRLFNSEAAVIAEGAGYLRIIGISYVITAISFGFMFVLRSVGKVKLPMIISLIAVIINAVLNYIFIFGHYGMPQMGARGAALGTTIARVIELTVLLLIVYCGKYVIAARFKELIDINKELFSRYIKTALPVILNEMIWACGVTIYSMVFGYMGKKVLAATTIAQTVEQLSMVLIFGFSNSCAVMLGHQLGAKKFDKAFEYAKRFAIIGPVVAILIGAIVAGTSHYIVSIFNVDNIVKDYIIGCLIILSCYMPFKVFNLINVVGILRSGGDTRFTLLLDIGGVWCVGVPLAILAGVFLKLPIYWVYALVLSEEAFKAIVGIPRFLSRKWIKNIVD